MAATRLSFPAVGAAFHRRPPNRHRNSADFCYTIYTQENTMEPIENLIVVYQPNETVRLDVRFECYQCENVVTGQFQFPMEEAA